MNTFDTVLKNAGFSEKFITIIKNTNNPADQGIGIEDINFSTEENTIISSATLEIKEANSASTNFITIDNLIK